jgi:ParB/RepB/Spo0J family partition protein
LHNPRSREKVVRMAAEEVKQIPIGLLAPDPMNIRVEPKIDDEFRKSIKKGVIEPLIVRSISSIEDKKAREELLAKGKQFAVTAGVRRYEAATQAELETVPCIVRELKDLEAMALSIAENKHRKDIPPPRWVEIIRDFYEKLEGTKEQRYRKIVEMTGIGESTVREYLLLSEHLTPDFVARLKEPEERSFSEKELLAERAPAPSEEKALIGESGEEIAPFEKLPMKAHTEPPRIPEKVMVKLVQDEDFRKLMKKDPAKAHELATEAALKGRNHVGEVLRKIRERPKRQKDERPAVIPPIGITAKIILDIETYPALERYAQEHNSPDLRTAATEVTLEGLKEKTLGKWVDLDIALTYFAESYLVRHYAKKEEVKA